jgi:predicted O-methyltransferase YrrM
MTATITAINEDPTWAVQVQRPMISPTKPGKIDLVFINAADEDKVKFWAKMQFGMYAEVIWCAKVGA